MQRDHHHGPVKIPDPGKQSSLPPQTNADENVSM